MKTFTISRESSFRSVTQSRIEEETVPTQYCVTKNIYRPIKIIQPPPQVPLKEITNITRKSCNCKKSQCLKQYCDCFANQMMCNEDCNCCGCMNTTQHVKLRKQAKQQIQNRDPAAFKAGMKGCNCKKSGCRKKMNLLFIVLLYTAYSDETTTYVASDTHSFRIVNRINRPNGIMFFTEGLSFINDGTLLESTGLYGDSEIHYIKDFWTESPQLVSRHQIPSEYFGEGCARVADKNGNDRVLMMTYKERKAFQFLPDLSEVTATFDMPDEIAEGWGMTHFIGDGKEMLLVSDGTNKLFHVDPSTFQITKTVYVKSKNGEDLNNLNELEYYKDGSVLANVYGSSYVAVIQIEDGLLQDMWDFQPLLEDIEQVKGHGFTDPMFDRVMNGIAYRDKRLVLGGKKWPYFFEIEMVQSDAQ